MSEYPKEIALFFVGSGPHTWPIANEEREKVWRERMESIVAAIQDGKGWATKYGDDLWLHCHPGNFVGWEIRQVKPTHQEQLLNLLFQQATEQSQIQQRVLKEMDPDADAPWRQDE